MIKWIFILTVFAITAMSCNKDTGDSIDDLYKDAPRSDMPDELAPANWRYGGLSALSYYNDRGDHVANASEALREYHVTEDGYVEFVQYLAVSSGACYNMTYTHLKGTMKFEAPNKILWTPVEGEFYKKFPCSGTVDTRKAERTDLERSRSEYWYKFDDFGTGKDYIVLYSHPSMTDQYQEFAYEMIR